MNSSAIVATVENGVVKLPAGSGLPDGTVVVVEPAGPPEVGRTLAERLAPFIGIGTALPPDLAAHHDHYLHGAPRQQP